MMDIDQPIPSANDDKMESVSVLREVENKSPNSLVQENDDLPPLLISDSEDDEPAVTNAPEEKKQIEDKGESCLSSDISGICPLDETAKDVKVEKNKSTDSRSAKDTPSENASTKAIVVADDIVENMTENIDLTEASSAEESMISDPGGETSIKKDKKPTKFVKDCSKMTAQELLQSLIGEQEENITSKTTVDNDDEQASSDRSDLIKLNDTSLKHQSKEENTLDKTVRSSMDESARLPINETSTGSPQSDLKLSEDTEANLGEAARLENTSDDRHPVVDAAERTLLAAKDCNHDESVAPELSTEFQTSDISLKDCAKSPSAIDEECMVEEIPNLPATQQANDVVENTAVSHSPNSGRNENPVVDDLELPEARENNDNQIEEPMDFDDPDNSEPPRKKLRPSDEFLSDTDNQAVNDERNTEKDENDCVGSDITNSKDFVGGQRKVGEETAENNDAQSSNENDEISKPAQAQVNPSKDLSGPIEILVIDDEDEEIENKSEKNVIVAADNDKNDTTKLASESGSEGSKEGQVGNPRNIIAESLRAEFLKRFSKPINQMNRYDLEQLVLQKVSESIMYKSEVADLRRQISRQEQMLQGFKRKLMDMTKHYDDLKIVTERAVTDLKKRAKSFVAPVKITRAVGLQVHKPIAFDQGVPPPFRSPQKNPSEASSPIVIMAAPPASEIIDVSTHQKLQERSRDATPKSMSNVGGQRQVSAKQNRQSIPGNLPPLNAIKTTSSITNSPALNGMVRANKSHGARSLNGVPVVNSTTNASSRVAVPPINNNVVTTTPTHTATANNTIVNSNSNSESNFNTSGSDASVRKKSLHKITPMRPYLSPYQQAQQEKQVRQHQELLVQQIHEQNQQAQRKAQLNAQQDHLTGGNTDSRNSTEGGTPRQRPAFNMPPGRLVTGAVQSSNTQATTGCPSRTSSSVVSSTTPTAVSRSKSANTTVSPSPVDSLIDLTDEDESTRNAQGVVTSKRPKLTANGTQTLASSTHLTPGSTAAVASNQLVRLTQGAMRPQQRVSTTDGAVPAAMNATATVVYQHNGSVVRTTVPKRPAATIWHPVRMAGQTNQRPRVPSTADQGLMKKRMVTKMPSQINSVLVPLPSPGPQPSNPMWKLSPPQPTICVNNVQTGIVISWSMPTLGDQHEVIDNYQIYAYQVSNSGGTDEWRHVGDVRALLLPMAVTLTQFQEGQRYHFAVRAIDVHKRVGAFSEPRTWNDTNVSNI
ncbi:activating transcription factor 7-interacting protein 1 [Anopheles nili]|uniref:activating transcription factor 7-interacting protein 1 n=1 Tax=Anopheles nili TaxID=185578 RepID=UPI00237B79A0|nr:activating transcription factor 7-interacting protein 1 [Anopheles nili]